MSRLEISELFTSLQGESTHTGEICSFIRLTGCNLRCAYCDTTYSHSRGNFMELDEILRWVAQQRTTLVEITGGEPLCQEGAIRLAQRLIQEGYRVLVETNGTKDISLLPDETIKIVDYKLPGSGRKNTFLRANFSCLRPTDELKFVISGRDDYTAAKTVVQAREPSCTVIFSPVWECISPQKLAEWIIADRLPVRMGLQMHKVIWDSQKRGV
ncbi:MAG: radical SAM protein [Fibrobacterota bacterium]